jgi:hypothetical protein
VLWVSGEEDIKQVKNFEENSSAWVKRAARTSKWCTGVKPHWARNLYPNLVGPRNLAYTASVLILRAPLQIH